MTDMSYWFNVREYGKNSPQKLYAEVEVEVEEASVRCQHAIQYGWD